MSEDETRKARQQRRAKPSKQYIQPDEKMQAGVPVDLPAEQNQVQSVQSGMSLQYPAGMYFAQTDLLPAWQNSNNSQASQNIPQTAPNQVREAGVNCGAVKRPRRVSKNWYWPDDDSELEDGERMRSPKEMTYSITQEFGLTECEVAAIFGKGETAGTKPKEVLQEIDDHSLSPAINKTESEQFAQTASELFGKNIVTEMDARSAIERIAHSLENKTTSIELTEFSAKIAAAVKDNTDLLPDIIELCRASERGRISADVLTRLFKQLNKLYEGTVQPLRRDLSVAHFLRAAAATLTIAEATVFSNLELCEFILLRYYPDRAVDLLHSILTATLANTEELAIRAFKFDRERVKNTVRVAKDALEPDPEMRYKENILNQNYFSHLFSTVAINAALQASNPKARYICKQGHATTYIAQEEEIEVGVFRVVSSAMRDFVGLYYDEMSWANRQFAGQCLSTYLPERLSY